MSTTEYEIGNFYSVPTVRGKVSCILTDWPVLGPMHDDRAVIGFPYRHYHLDWRFVARDIFESLDSSPFHRTVYSLVLHVDSRLNPQLPAPVLRRRKCRRSWAEVGRYPSQVPWLDKLEQAYAGCKLTDDMICPHRGIPLNGAERTGDVITCPGHGLRWNATTGALITG
jgi:hypothetical protein